MTAVVKKKTGEVSPTYDYGDQAGAGFENTDSSHLSIPFLKMLQSGSPEIADGVEGAKAGEIANTVTGEIFSGKTGVVFVPCHADHVFVEWTPRSEGGGLVNQHLPTSQVVLDARSSSTQFGKYKVPRPGGGENELTETFYLYGLLLTEPDSEESSEMVVIWFQSTSIKPYKHIMYRLHSLKASAPLFAHRLRIKTIQQVKGGDKFFNYDIAPVNGAVDRSLIPPMDSSGNPHRVLVAGEALLKAVTSGQAKAAHETNTGSERSGSDTESAPF